MNCMYCDKGKNLEELMDFVCELKSSNVYLVKNQNYLGRCVVAHKKHVKEIFELSKEEREEYINDLSKVAKVLSEIFEADKINYGIYGDTVPHLHCHVVPKKETRYGWGVPFTLTGNDTFIEDVERGKIIEKIKEGLRENG